MEELGGIVGLAQLHGLERDSVGLNYWATGDKAKPFVHGHCVQARIDREFAWVAQQERLSLDHVPQFAAKASTLKWHRYKQMVEVTVVSKRDDANQLALIFGDQVLEVAGGHIALNCRFADGCKEWLSAFS